MINDDFLRERLEARAAAGNKRLLPSAIQGEDFVSNDYLGLANNDHLIQRIDARWQLHAPKQVGGTGSRLLSGNHDLYEELESLLQTVFQAESVLVFNSGYQANQALVASVASRGERILYDELSHVCLKEGAWLSKADSFSFRHNDLEDMERRLKQDTDKRTFVVTETLFSMDGDFAPIAEMLDLCEKYGAYLIVDEAHSTGAYGAAGGGWLIEQGLADRVFARVYTFGKAMGAHGACIAGSSVLTEYLTNFARSFIYTTAMPPHAVLSLIESFQFLGEHMGLQDELREVVKYYRETCEKVFDKASKSYSAIQPVWISGSDKALEASKQLQENGYQALAIRPPTVKAGTERLRISLHTFNSKASIDGLIGCLKEVM
ncbi:MAG: 8-amino-7-oxononanoate synthase [Cytophagales bacterium]|nr:8-amino-7-oxononanoate synthase [Cytophagales bacterium]